MENLDFLTRILLIFFLLWWLITQFIPQILEMIFGPEGGQPALILQLLTTI
jgi:hypothetical protein